MGTLDFYEAANKLGVQYEDWMAGAMMRAELLSVLAESLPQGVLQLGIIFFQLSFVHKYKKEKM